MTHGDLDAGELLLTKSLNGFKNCLGCCFFQALDVCDIARRANIEDLDNRQAVSRCSRRVGHDGAHEILIWNQIDAAPTVCGGPAPPRHVQLILSRLWDGLRCQKAI